METDAIIIYYGEYSCQEFQSKARPGREVQNVKSIDPGRRVETKSMTTSQLKQTLDDLAVEKKYWY